MPTRTANGSPERNWSLSSPSLPSSAADAIVASPEPHSRRPAPRSAGSISSASARRYRETASRVGPSKATRPCSRKTERSHSRSTEAASCETNTIVPPSCLKLKMRPKHFRWNASSPTANTSSRSRVSASRNAAMAKPSRIVIPDEYVRTGRSIACSSSANATISSKRVRISERRSPWIAPFRKTFSRPVKSGWKPAPSSSSEPMRPSALTRPAVGLMIPAISRSSVVLPEPFRPMRPDRFTGRDAERHVVQRPDVLAAASGRAGRRGP